MFIPETELIITSDGVELFRVSVKPGDYVIGSSEEVDIVVQAPGVGERHALLTVNYHELFIEDLGSGSTLVGGSSATKCTRIWPNQRVQLGSAVLDTRRSKAPSDSELSIAPETEMLRQVLPPEFLQEKKYEIGGMVARGEMGDIVDAFEATTGRTVAMKVMLSTLSEEEILRFIGEAQITSQLEHPNIVPVHELGVDEEDHVFYTMKLVRGVTLRRILKSLAAHIPATIVAHPLAVLLTVFQKICDGVAFAHSKSVYHCDLRPANIKIGEYGEVLVMDWEQARCYGTEDCGLDEQERMEAEAADRQRDIAAIGAILYQILSLQPPAEEGPIEPLVRANSLRRGSTTGSRSGVRNLPHLPGGRIPESLAAVAMKALLPRPGEEYQSVQELQADITAYQDGFATSAERAGPLKQLALLVRRHKREATAFAASIVLLMALGLGAYLYTAWERNVALREGQRAEKERLEAEAQRADAATQTASAEIEGKRAEQTLSDLRSAAPAYQRQAISFIQAQKFGEANEALGFAVALAPDNPDYHLLQGQVLQTLQRLPEAAESFRRVLALRTDDQSAKTNLELCERLLAAAAGGPLTRALQTQLLDAIVAQRRSADGVFLASSLNLQSDARMVAIREKLKSVTQHPKWNDTRLVKRDDGTFALDLSDIPLTSLSLLEGLPISDLKLSRVGIFDLTPLASLPLQSLDCSGNPVFDLAPLSGLHIRSLSLDATRVADLSPLKGMALQELSLAHSAVADLSVLQGMPLETLSLNGLPVQSIEVLRGMPLQRLDLFGCQQLTNFAALKTLTRLDTLNVPAHFTDLALAQNLRSLKRLGSGDFGGGRAAFEKVPNVAGFIAAYGNRLALQARFAPRLEQLRNTLRQLGAADTVVAAVALGADGFLDLDLTGVPLDNLLVLNGLPIRRLVIKGTKVADLTPLRGMPLVTLDASSTLVTDLAPLATCPTLQVLDVSQTGVANLRPISTLRLTRLVLAHTPVRDLAPLLRMPLRTLRLDDTAVEDLRPLATCTALESVTLSRRARDPSPLRKLSSLLRVSNDWDTRNGQPTRSAAEFWAEYDSSGSARELDAKLNAMLAKFRLLTGWREDRCEKIYGNAYKLDLSELNISDLSPLRDLPIAILNISRTAVTRLGPIVNCPIRELSAYDCVLADPAILGRLPLERLEFSQDGPSDLQHLRGLKLLSLTVHFKPGRPFTPDLSALKGMPLETFYAYGFSELVSLRPLEGAPIARLRIPGAGVKDLGPLRKMPLAELDVSSTQITDISPLQGLPLTYLNLMYTKVRDVSVLADCKSLSDLVLPRDAKGIDRLRQLPNLKHISVEQRSDDDNAPSLTAEEFWAEFGGKAKP
jgi:Leucine-rich repeat (LRR) protein